MTFDPGAPLTHPSPNHRARKSPARFLILHGSTGSDKGDLEWCAMDAAALRALWEKMDPAKRPAEPWKPVSYHSLVQRDGDWCRMVALDRVAYHAGVSEWAGLKNLNEHSIGVAFSNRCDEKEQLTEAQYDVMLGIVEGLARTIVTLEAVLTHSMVSPGRKHDPENCAGFGLSPFAAAFARGVAAR